MTAKTSYKTTIENGIEYEVARPECQPDPKLYEARKNAPRYTLVEKKHLLDLIQGKEISEELENELVEKTKLKYWPNPTYPCGNWEVYYLTPTGSFGTAVAVHARTVWEACFDVQMLLSSGSDYWPEDFFIRGAKLIEFVEKDPNPEPEPLPIPSPN